MLTGHDKTREQGVDGDTFDCKPIRLLNITFFLFKQAHKQVNETKPCCNLQYYSQTYINLFSECVNVQHECVYTYMYTYSIYTYTYRHTLHHRYLNIHVLCPALSVHKSISSLFIKKTNRKSGTWWFSIYGRVTCSTRHTVCRLTHVLTRSLSKCQPTPSFLIGCHSRHLLQ